jgi:hypothetical protein
VYYLDVSEQRTASILKAGEFGILEQGTSMLYRGAVGTVS